MQVVIEIPKEVLYDTKQTIEQATDFAKSVTALGFSISLTPPKTISYLSYNNEKTPVGVSPDYRLHKFL